MFLPEGLGSLPDAQTDHPHTRSSDRKSSGRFSLLFRMLEQSLRIYHGHSCNLVLLILLKEDGILTMIPDTAVTLDTVCISQRAGTGMGAQTFPAMAHPSFTEVTHCPLGVKRKTS